MEEKESNKGKVPNKIRKREKEKDIFTRQSWVTRFLPVSLPFPVFFQHNSQYKSGHIAQSSSKCSPLCKGQKELKGKKNLKDLRCKMAYMNKGEFSITIFSVKSRDIQFHLAFEKTHTSHKI